MREFEPLTELPPVQYVEQYLGVWAIEESTFSALWSQVKSLDLRSHVEQNTPNVAAKSTKERNLVRIDIRGTMTKQGSSLSGAGSTVRIRQAIRDAGRDASVDGILLVWDTGGGTAAGTPELAADIREAAKAKPVLSFIEDLCASAGFWGASQATAVYANQAAAMVGSIGTFLLIYDVSEMAAKEGIRPVLIKTGEFKGAGAPGVAIGDNVAGMWQELVNAIQKQFTSDVKTARSLTSEQVEAVTTAKLFTATEAQKHGLIDGVKSYEAAVRELDRLVSQNRKDKTMSTTVQKTPASLDDLKAACPGATSEFLLKHLEAGSDAAIAARAYTDSLRLQVQARDEQIATLKTENEGLKSQVELLKKGKGSHAAVTTTPTSGGTETSAAEEIAAMVGELVKGGMSKTDAHTRVMRKHPELRERLIAETNAKAKA